MQCDALQRTDDCDRCNFNVFGYAQEKYAAVKGVQVGSGVRLFLAGRQ